jgi:hypothetical protein
VIKELKESYGDLFEQGLLSDIGEVGVLKQIPAGEILIDIASYIRYVPLFLSGDIKILRSIRTMKFVVDIKRPPMSFTLPELLFRGF